MWVIRESKGTDVILLNSSHWSSMARHPPSSLMHRQTGCCDRPPTYAHTAGAAFRLVQATEQPATAVSVLNRPDS